MGEAAKKLKQISYEFIDDNNVLFLINAVRKGVDFNFFKNLVAKSPFSQEEWSSFLHLSERTLQRYQKEKRAFDPIHSEKILEIALLYKKGIDVFGGAEQLNVWLNAKSVALGGIKPKELLDNTFGIGLLKDELNRIEHGILS